MTRASSAPSAARVEHLVREQQVVAEAGRGQALHLAHGRAGEARGGRARPGASRARCTCAPSRAGADARPGSAAPSCAGSRRARAASTTSAGVTSCETRTRPSFARPRRCAPAPLRAYARRQASQTRRAVTSRCVGEPRAPRVSQRPQRCGRRAARCQPITSSIGSCWAAVPARQRAPPCRPPLGAALAQLSRRSRTRLGLVHHLFDQLTDVVADLLDHAERPLRARCAPGSRPARAGLPQRVAGRPRDPPRCACGGPAPCARRPSAHRVDCSSSPPPPGSRFGRRYETDSSLTRSRCITNQCSCSRKLRGT